MDCYVMLFGDTRRVILKHVGRGGPRDMWSFLMNYEIPRKTDIFTEATKLLKNNVYNNFSLVGDASSDEVELSYIIDLDGGKLYAVETANIYCYTNDIAQDSVIASVQIRRPEDYYELTMENWVSIPFPEN